MNALIKLGLVFLALAMLTACSGRKVQPDPAFAAAEPIPQDNVRQATGGIYQISQGGLLYEDPKAHAVGDILTVLLQEQTSGSTKAATQTAKDDSVQIDNPTVFNRPVTWQGEEILGANLSAERAFKGSGDTSQSNQLTGSISVVVAKVYSNGNMLVKGEKIISLNQGSEFIRISGIVRPQDISASNTIPSTLVANAQIAYGGDGMLNDANSQGWLARFFNSSWWPF